jgi:hypothetical protein
LRGAGAGGNGFREHTEAQTRILVVEDRAVIREAIALELDRDPSFTVSRPLTDFSGPSDGSSGGIWTATPPYSWVQSPAGNAVSYLSGPLSSDTTVIGAGAVHAWIRSSTPNVDLQATITEVRPDGNETFVQNGWVQADERKLDPRKGTLLEPVLSLRKSDVSPLPRNRFVEVTIPLYYEGHAYRAGSRIRAGAIQERHPGVRDQTGHVDLLHAAVCTEDRRGGAAGEGSSCSRCGLDGRAADRSTATEAGGVAESDNRVDSGR